MSLIPLVEAKNDLRVIHAHDDELLQRLLDGAEREALEYMDRETFGELCPNDSNFADETEAMPPDVRTGVMTLLEARYRATPQDAEQLRMSAERILHPYRCQMGV